MIRLDGPGPAFLQRHFASEPSRHRNPDSGQGRRVFAGQPVAPCYFGGAGGAAGGGAMDTNSISKISVALGAIFGGKPRSP